MEIRLILEFLASAWLCIRLSLSVYAEKKKTFSSLKEACVNNS